MSDPNLNRPGYKETKVGWIPEGWTVRALGNLCTSFSGGTPASSNVSFYGGDIPWITSSDLNSHRITEVKGRITAAGLENSSAKIVDAHTLLLALYGATAGVSSITEIGAAINQAVLAIIPTNVEVEYLSQFLQLRKDFFLARYTQGGSRILAQRSLRPS